MFEEKIEKTIGFLGSLTIGERDSITLRQIEDSDVPEALKRIFDAEVEQWIEDEKARLLSSPHFHYTDDEILHVFDSIVEKARNYASFTREEFALTLDKSVKLLFNFVCRPQWTLVKYLFADRENATTESLLESLEYFVDYEYYRLILTEYFHSKELTVINARKFEELIENIDKEVIRTFDSRKMAFLTEPLFRLFSLGSDDEEQRAPIEALSIFFDDKDYPMIVERLDAEKERTSDITIHELVLLISDVDFSVSQDIFSIVSQRSEGMGRKPEKNVTAGEEYDIPEVTERLSDDGREAKPAYEDLDYVITAEEGELLEHVANEIPDIDADEEDFSSVVDEGILDLEDDLMIAQDEDETEVDEVEISGEEALISTTTDEGALNEYEIDRTESEDNSVHADDDEISWSESELDDDDAASFAAGDDKVSVGDAEDGVDEISLAQGPMIDGMVESDEDSTLVVSDDIDVEEGSAQEYLTDDDDLAAFILEEETDSDSNIISQPEDDEFVLEDEDLTKESEDSFKLEDDGTQVGGVDYNVPDDMYLEEEQTLSADDDISVPDTVIGNESGYITDDSDTMNNVILVEDEESVLPDLDSVELPEIQLNSIEIESSGTTIGDTDFLIPDFRTDEDAETEELFKDIALEELMEDDPDEEDDQDEGDSREAAMAPIPAVESAQPKAAERLEEVPVASPQVLEAFGDLDGQIASSDKKKYVKRLFSKDEDAYKRAIATLNGKASWREASEYIDELFIKFNVDMYSRVAVKFTDDVYKRYLNKKA